MIPPDRAGSLSGSSPARMTEVWRRIYSALNEAQAALEDSGALHARDFSTPEAFGAAKAELMRDYTDITGMRARALAVLVVWDAQPKPTEPPPKQTLVDVWNEAARRAHGDPS